MSQSGRCARRGEGGGCGFSTGTVGHSAPAGMVKATREVGHGGRRSDSRCARGGGTEDRPRAIHRNRTPSDTHAHLPESAPSREVMCVSASYFEGRRSFAGSSVRFCQLLRGKALSREVMCVPASYFEGRRFPYHASVKATPWADLVPPTNSPCRTRTKPPRPSMPNPTEAHPNSHDVTPRRSHPPSLRPCYPDLVTTRSALAPAGSPTARRTSAVAPNSCAGPSATPPRPPPAPRPG